MGSKTVYWVYKRKFLFLKKEEFIFEIEIPEGRSGWATSFTENPGYKIHYFDGSKNDYGGLQSICNRDTTTDDELTLFVKDPPTDDTCKLCVKKLESEL